MKTVGESENFEVVKSVICAIFTPYHHGHCKNLAAGTEVGPKRKIIFNYFQTLMRFQLLLKQNKFMGKV